MPKIQKKRTEEEKNDRPRLLLFLCRKYKVKLIIAKLNRLASNIHFISGL